MAWARFAAETRVRAKARYLEAIGAWKGADGYAIPGEFVVVAACKPHRGQPDRPSNEP